MNSKEKMIRMPAVHPRVFPRLITFGIGLAIVATLILPVGLTGASAQDTLTVTVTIDSAELNNDRTATVTYTVECSEDATIHNTFASVSQSTGRFGNKQVFGAGEGFEINEPCDESGVQLTQTVIAERGFFVPGRATVIAQASACLDDLFNCDGDGDEQVVRLSR